jgi:hypothetical protein
MPPQIMRLFLAHLPDCLNIEQITLLGVTGNALVTPVTLVLPTLPERYR